jgi:hypothetical protein
MTVGKVWNDMTREELLVEKSIWESRLQEHNQQFNAIKRRAYAEKVYLPPAEFEKLEDTRKRLASSLRGINTLLAMHKRKPFDSYFYAAADKVIEDAELFDRIYDLAEDLMAADNKGAQA